MGGGGYPGTEEVWDILLTRGKRIYGIAVDDAHIFQGEIGPYEAHPGRGWVVVKARALEAGEIMRSLEAGLFYASTGVKGKTWSSRRRASRFASSPAATSGTRPRSSAAAVGS